MASCVGIYLAAIVEQIAVIKFVFCVDKKTLDFEVINKNSKINKLGTKDNLLVKVIDKE